MSKPTGITPVSEASSPKRSAYTLAAGVCSAVRSSDSRGQGVAASGYMKHAIASVLEVRV
jgi:hypothetical protein